MENQYSLIRRAISSDLITNQEKVEILVFFDDNTIKGIPDLEQLIETYCSQTHNYTDIINLLYVIYNIVGPLCLLKKESIIQGKLVFLLDYFTKKGNKWESIANACVSLGFLTKKNITYKDAYNAAYFHDIEYLMDNDSESETEDEEYTYEDFLRMNGDIDM